MAPSKRVHSGGSGGSGTLFRLESDGSNFMVLHAFDYVPPLGWRDARYGLYPYGGLTQGSDGLFYGAAYGGGIVTNAGGYQLYYAGTLYRLNPDGTGLALLHSFGGVDPLPNTNSDGANSYSTLHRPVSTLFLDTPAGSVELERSAL